MDHQKVGRYWNENAAVWTRLARAGYDVYRDYLNTPAFFELLPPVAGLSGLDIGCGEGHNTRLPRFTRTIAQWLNLLLDTGFALERLAEPRPNEQTVQARPDLQDAQVVAYFLQIRARKPTGSLQ